MAFDSRRECRYRGSFGTKCALGVLIPDADYDPMMENFSADQVVWAIPALKSVNINAMQMMQYYHDGSLTCQLDYEKWIMGDATHHPRIMADKILAELTRTGKVNI